MAVSMAHLIDSSREVIVKLISLFAYYYSVKIPGRWDKSK